MILIRSCKQMTHQAFLWGRCGDSIGFVPTLGALHAGHLSLISRARQENKRVVVSIFVNPTQFGPREDFTRYPRPFQKDARLVRSQGVDVLFAPRAQEIYPSRFSTWVNEEALSQFLCGPFRPGHFRGVATVVTQLFHLVKPTRAYFGEKDYQQFCLIQRIVRDLHMPIQVVGCPTVREKNGLALSSRNTYLSGTQRAQAPLLYQALTYGANLIRQASRQRGNPREVERKVKERLKQSGSFKVDYVSLCHPETLEPLQGRLRPGVLAVAARFGRTRLIDHIAIH